MATYRCYYINDVEAGSSEEAAIPGEEVDLEELEFEL